PFSDIFKLGFHYFSIIFQKPKPEISTNIPNFRGNGFLIYHQFFSLQAQSRPFFTIFEQF
ncbi:MAG TPA: hypothetical protein DFL85_04180, partial [Lentisphaeria bacterium]|nr:hypothetical protein [Lentisphaeria bacterium]